jgi:hypothetical protein
MPDDENDRPITEADVARGIEAFLNAVGKLEKRVVDMETLLLRQQELLLKLHAAYKNHQAALQVLAKKELDELPPEPTGPVN